MGESTLSKQKSQAVPTICGQLLLRNNLVSEHINLNKKRVELSMVTRDDCDSTSDDETIPVLAASEVSEGHDSVEEDEEDDVEGWMMQMDSMDQTAFRLFDRLPHQRR